MRWMIVFAAVLLAVSLVVEDAQAASGAQLRVLQSDRNRVVLELELSRYDLQAQSVSGVTYVVLSVPELGHTNEPGKPQLPIRGALVGIPPGAQPSLKIVADETRVDSLAYPPLPAPRLQIQKDPRQSMPREPGVVIAPDVATYASKQPYPVEVARIASSGNWRSQRYVIVEFHPLQYVGTTRQLIFHRLVRVEVTFSYAAGKTPQALGSAVNEGSFEQVLQQTVVNYASAKSWRMKSAPAKLPTTRDPIPYTSGEWYKLAVNLDGIYRITCAQLASAGIDVGSLNPNTLKIYKQGTKLAINVVGNTWGTCDSSDYLEFFGQAAQTKYTDTNIYWLTYGGTTDGKWMGTRDGSGIGTLSSTFTDTLHLEQDLDYQNAVPMLEGADHWYWNYVSEAYGIPSQDYSFQLANPASGIFSASLQVSFQGYNTGSHHTIIYINGNLIDDTAWSGTVERRATIAFPQSFLNVGTNTIRVSEPSDLDPIDAIFTNHFDIGYVSVFTTTNDVRRFRLPAIGAWHYQIGGFSNADVETFDITDPFNVSQIVTMTITPTGSSYMLEFSDTISAPREYMAVATEPRLTPLSITHVSLPDLYNSANGADYIIISYGEFISHLQSLVNLRKTQFSRPVKVVDVQDVYDEFSDGLMDPQAIRDFLAYAYANWQMPKPQFVLLVGDGTFDPKGNCVTPGVCPWITTPPNSTFIPPFLRMVDPWMGETASDNRFVSFDDGTGNTMPSMAIGRLPADNVADVDAMVAKIVNYEQNLPEGNWQSKVTFVADKPDSAGNFWALSDLIANDPYYLRPPYTADRIYYPNPPYTTPSATRSAIVSAINDGRMIVNYVGHSGKQWWSNAFDQTEYGIFGLNEVAALANNGKVPVILDMTCMDGYFIEPGLSSLAEANVRRAGGGALASWSASGQGIAAGHDFLDRGFLDAVLQHSVTQIGTATMLGKMNLWLNGGGANLDLIDTFNLFGDPASRLVIQPFTYYLPLIQRK